MSKVYSAISFLLIVAILFLSINLFMNGVSSPTGYFTATPTGASDVNVTVSQAVSILVNAGSQINFGSLFPSDSNSTQSGTGIILENNGSFDVNISASSNGFFTSANIPNGAVSRLSCKASASGGGSATFWQSTYVDCYDAAEPRVIGCLTYADDTDEARIDLNIVVPTDEPAGLKTGIVTFTASGC
ncbi:MAG: hypothetical protein PHD05_03085 [Sphaerochaetaceae bacterium]|nr:hypothetical protein [Sphaerochaetaceae bacterium]